MTIQEVINLIKKYSQDNYRDGNPQIPPHQHDGVDNLQLNPINFLGYPIFEVTDATVAPTDTKVISGTLRFQYDGTNFTLWVMNGTEWAEVGGGGGGGTPGGSNTQVQFNDSGAFGGDSAFTWNKTTNTLTLDDGSASGADGVIITGGTSSINLVTDDTTGTNDSSGYIEIIAGASTGSNANSGGIDIIAGDSDDTGFPGEVFIQAGKSGSVGVPGQNTGGRVSITAGNSGDANGGDILINTGNATASGDGGRLIVTLGGTDSGGRPYFQVKQFDGFGTVQPNIAFGSSTSFGGGQGVLYIRNRTTAPSSDPSSGGILYVESGALMYRGSGGTVTTIAPA